ncbi:MAG: OsmC family protein [Firmicutes bacterium]|jgi:uncharacterized OsmC-like protein|nr:OsmC family protein [Bacillota bacterium]
MQRNGIDLDQLTGTVEAVTAQPNLARFQFRSETIWKSGGYSETQIQSFYGAGQEDDSRSQPFMVESDEPGVLLGTNKAPNAVELVLAALASCLTVGITYNAAARGIQIQALTLKLEGDLDVQGFLGLSDAVRPGYEGIRVHYHVQSDASAEQLAELLAHVEKTSPVLDIVRHPVPVTFIPE